MTRFARADGSKSSNKKHPEKATPWRVLKQGLSDSNKNNEDSDTQEDARADEDTKDETETLNDQDKTWSTIENKPGSSNSGQQGVKRMLDQVDSFNIKGWRLDEQSIDKLKKLKTDLLEKGTDPSEIADQLYKETKLLKKRARKNMNKKCFQCMQSGHQLKDCPNNKDCRICFVCGSSEHLFKDCKSKKSSHSKFAFATCFICKQQGHISTSCPDNPSGLYPYGGGCRECGEVTHFAKDCPELMKAKEASGNKFTLQTLSDDVEGLSEETALIKSSEPPSKKTKIVKF